MSIRHYQDLEVWQYAMDLVDAIYRVTADFPDSERYGLKTQLQRAGVSVPSNIAEGHARSSTKDYMRFISFARGSLAELETQLLLAIRLDLAAKNRVEKVLVLADRVSKMLNRLQSSLRKKVSSDTRIPSPGLNFTFGQTEQI